MRVYALLVFVVGWSTATAQEDCQTTGCADGGTCCLCSCDAGDYAAGMFSCNCDNTKKHKPLPNSEQPACCGGEYGFDAWCVKKDTPSVDKLQCSNQTTAGVPLPSNDFYQFGVSHRCVYPPHTCNSGFCDNPAVPDLASQTCHKPYVPGPGPAPATPAPAAPAPAPVAPAPADCKVSSNKPIGCPCDHSFECVTDWCTGTCQKKPGMVRRPRD